MLLSEWGGNGILSAWAVEGGVGGAASAGLLTAGGTAPRGGAEAKTKNVPAQGDSC